MKKIQVHMNVRVICVSRPLPAHDAIAFARHFRPLFEPLFVWSETNGRLKRERFRHYYCVVRVPQLDETRIPRHEMKVDMREILGMIPAYRRVTHQQLGDHQSVLPYNGSR